MITEKMIPIEKIVTSEEYAAHAKLESVDHLAASMRQYGLLQPVIVTIDRTHEGADSFLLLDGHRRLAAAKSLNYQVIRANIIVESPDSFDDGSGEIQSDKDLCKTFAVNLLRKKVSYEKLEAAVLKLHSQGWGYGKIAEKFGYSKAGIQKIINRAKRQEPPCSVDTAKEFRLLKRTHTALDGIAELQFDNVVFEAIEQVKAALKKRMLEIEEKKHSGNE